jgi:hypothetical protein
MEAKMDAIISRHTEASGGIHASMDESRQDAATSKLLLNQNRTRLNRSLANNDDLNKKLAKADQALSTMRLAQRTTGPTQKTTVSGSKCIKKSKAAQSKRRDGSEKGAPDAAEKMKMGRGTIRKSRELRNLESEEAAETMTKELDAIRRLRVSHKTQTKAQDKVEDQEIANICQDSKLPYSPTVVG